MSADDEELMCRHILPDHLKGVYPGISKSCFICLYDHDGSVTPIRLLHIDHDLFGYDRCKELEPCPLQFNQPCPHGYFCNYNHKTGTSRGDTSIPILPNSKSITWDICPETKIPRIILSFDCHHNRGSNNNLVDTDSREYTTINKDPYVGDMHWGPRQRLYNQYTDLEKLRLRGMKELNINLPPIYKVPFEDLTSTMIVYEHHFSMMQHALLMISIILSDANEGSTSPAMPIQPDHSEDDSPEVGIGAPEDVHGTILELLQLKGCTVPDCIIHKSYVKLLKEMKDINVGVECKDMATEVASFILSLDDMIPLVKYDMEDKGYKLKHDDAFGNNVIMNALIDIGKKDEFHPEGRVNLVSNFIVYEYPGKDTLLLPVHHDWIEKATHIEADQQALDELKNSWNRQPHNESRGNKRKYDIISDESLTPINRGLHGESSSSTQSNPLSAIVLVNNPEVLPPANVSGKGVASGDPMEVESLEPTPKVDEPATLETETTNDDMVVDEDMIESDTEKMDVGAKVAQLAEEEDDEDEEKSNEEKSKEIAEPDTEKVDAEELTSSKSDPILEEDTIISSTIIHSLTSILTRQFECDQCKKLTACCRRTIGSDMLNSCLDCSGGIVNTLRVMHDEHREVIHAYSTSLSEEPADLRVFDTLVPPSAFCGHGHCRQIVTQHLMQDSTQHLKYCSCGKIVCCECYGYCQDNNNECINNAIDESYAWSSSTSNDHDDDHEIEVEYTGLEHDNLECQYSSVVYKPASGAYIGRLRETDSYYDTAVYSTGVESATQLAAHHFIKGFILPQKTVKSLAHFVSRLFNEIEIVSSTKVTSRNKKELGKLQGRLKRSVSESLRLIASNIRKHIDNNKYSQGNELTRANAVVASLHRIAQLADTSGGITSVEQFESDAVQNTLRGTDLPWSNFTDGGSRLDVSVDVGVPAPIDTTRPDIREMNEVMRLVFSRKESASNGDGDVYKFAKCFEPITGRGAAMNAEVNHEREINLRVHVCQCLIKVFAENPVRLRNLLNIEDVANLRYVHPETEDEEEDLDEEDDDVNLRLGDMIGTYSLDDIREQILLAVEEGRIDRDMSMRIIQEYAQSNVLANQDRVPIMCSTDNNKHSSPEAVEENEMKIISRLNNDEINTARILHDIAVVENEPKYTQQYVSKQNKRLTFILERTDLCQVIDENRSTTSTHSYDQFETILKTSFEAAANEFPDDLSHLKNATLENVCPIYSEEDWTDAEVRGPALEKLSRELPMVIANSCADKRCSRKLLDYDIVERGAVEANHLILRKGTEIPCPADFVRMHGAVKYIEHVIEYNVVANCNYHHSKREHRHQDIIPQKNIRLFKNTTDIKDIRRYNPIQLLSMSGGSTNANTELVRMQDKVTFSFLEFELRGGFSQNGDGCNASDMRCLVSDYFEDLPDHDILSDDMLAASNVEINNSFGMKYTSQYYDIHGTKVSKSGKVAIPLLTGLIKELCGCSKTEIL